MIDPEELQTFKVGHLRQWIMIAFRDGRADVVEQCVDELIRRINARDDKERVAEFDDPEMQMAWDEWQQHRKEMRRPITSCARERQLEQLRNLGKARAIAAIRYSADRGYVGIFEEKKTRFGKAPMKTAAEIEYEQFMADRSRRKQQQ